MERATRRSMLLVTCLVACSGPQSVESGGTPDGRPAAKDNRAPVLAPLFGEVDGRRVRVLEPGMEVAVRARASDPDGDRVRIRWVIAEGAGSLDVEVGEAVRWKIGEAPGGIRCIAYDGLGGQAHQILTITAGVVFAGHVVSTDGRPVAEATVTVQADTTRTDERGSFRLEVTDTEVQRFVLNIEKPGHGLVSKVYDQGVRNGRWTLRPATVQTVDPTKPILVQDTLSPSTCPGPLRNRIDWSQYPSRKEPRFVDAAGNLTTGPLPPELAQALALIEQGTVCSPGISIAIPGNALVDTAGNLPRGDVQVSVATVDLYAPDGMPGDYTVLTNDRPLVMQSFGAGTVTVTQDGEPLQLRSGAKATLTIPVDPLQLDVGTPDPTIPFLRYDEAGGTWSQIGNASFDTAGRSYAGSVDHLSTFNMDLIKVNQSCVRIESQISGTYHLEMIAPMESGAPVVRAIQISPDPSQPNQDLHALYNLPSQTWILLTAIREPTPGVFVPLGSYVVNTGSPQSPSQPNKPDYDYFACDSSVILSEVVPPQAIAVDGTDRIFGPLPIHIYSVVEPATGDIYPSGLMNGIYLFALFDTGSTKVRVFNEVPYWFIGYPDPNLGLVCNGPNRVTDGNWFNSDAGHLGLSAAVTANLRLNGLSAIDAGDLTAPLGDPGSAGGSQVEVANIDVIPQPTNPNQPYLDVTLIGAPVIHRVVARIDYTTQVTRAGYDFYPDLIHSNVGIPGFQFLDSVSGPDITFFAANDPGIPFPELQLELERWGLPERFLLRGVVFRDGANEVADQTGTVQFLFDTGTTPTIIGDQVAAALGLAPGAGDFDCFQPGDNKGYVIDEVVMTGPNGTYTVQNACICWDQDKIQNPTLNQAVIGSNLFDQVPVLFDGPRNRLGIGPPTSAPVVWQMIPRNCAGSPP